MTIDIPTVALDEFKKPSPLGRFRTVADLKDIKPPTYNIDGLLQQGTTALLWGLPGSTKTTHAIDWWARLSLGLDWCDAKVTKGITFYLMLEDLAGFRARVDAWQEHNETELPPWALWWDGGFDFSDECTAAVRAAMEAAQLKHDLPVVLITIDPIMAAFGEGTALDEQDFRQRLTAIKSMTAPFPEATTLPKLSESLSERCLVDSWKTEYERMRSDGSDTTPDSIRRAFDRAKSSLKKAGVASFYDNLAWIIWDTPDKPDMVPDK